MDIDVNFLLAFGTVPLILIITTIYVVKEIAKDMKAEK